MFASSISPPVPVVSPQNAGTLDAGVAEVQRKLGTETCRQDVLRDLDAALTVGGVSSDTRDTVLEIAKARCSGLDNLVNQLYLAHGCGLPNGSEHALGTDTASAASLQNARTLYFNLNHPARNSDVTKALPGDANRDLRDFITQILDNIPAKAQEIEAVFGTGLGQGNGTGLLQYFSSAFNKFLGWSGLNSGGSTVGSGVGTAAVAMPPGKPPRQVVQNGPGGNNGPTSLPAPWLDKVFRHDELSNGVKIFFTRDRLYFVDFYERVPEHLADRPDKHTGHRAYMEFQIPDISNDQNAGDARVIGDLIQSLKRDTLPANSNISSGGIQRAMNELRRHYRSGDPLSPKEVSRDFFDKVQATVDNYNTSQGRDIFATRNFDESRVTAQDVMRRRQAYTIDATDLPVGAVFNQVRVSRENNRYSVTIAFPTTIRDILFKPLRFGWLSPLGGLTSPTEVTFELRNEDGSELRADELDPQMLRERITRVLEGVARDTPRHRWSYMGTSPLIQNLLLDPQLKLTRVDNAYFYHANWIGVDLSGVVFNNCGFRGCQFIGAKVHGTEFRGCDIVACNMQNMDAEGGGGVRFSRHSRLDSSTDLRFTDGTVTFADWSKCAANALRSQFKFVLEGYGDSNRNKHDIRRHFIGFRFTAKKWDGDTRQILTGLDGIDAISLARSFKPMFQWELIRATHGTLLTNERAMDLLRESPYMNPPGTPRSVPVPRAADGWLTHYQDFRPVRSDNSDLRYRVCWGANNESYIETYETDENQKEVLTKSSKDKKQKASETIRELIGYLYARRESARQVVGSS